MGTQLIPYNRPISNRVHPRIWAAIIGITVWFVLAVWGFAASGYADYIIIAIVSAFAVVTVAIPLMLWRTWRRNLDRGAVRENDDNVSFRDWTGGEFHTWQYRVKGMNAVVEILLPIAIAAFGMTVFAIALYFTARGTV